MIIGIVAAILLLFSALGSETAFIDPKAKKDVKKYVVDKRTQEEILGLMKAFTKEYKAGRKGEKKSETQLEKLFSVKGNTIEDFQPVFDEYVQSRKSRQESYTKSILRTKSIISDAEWENMLSSVDSKIKKQLKEQEKMISEVEKTNEKMESQLKSHIDDEERSSQVSKIMSEVNTSEVAILKKLNAFNYKDNELLMDRVASEEEYIKAFKEYNDLWQEYFDLYVNAYMSLSEEVTDEEWKVIRKFSKQFF
jgi:hypothetical protein